ncbi:MAG TPA: hypothetical protein VGH11_19210 [Jatrophihabitans sp.]
MDALHSGVSAAGLVELQSAVSAYLEQDPVRLSDADQLTELRALEQLSRQPHAAMTWANRDDLLYVEGEKRSDDRSFAFDSVMVSASDPAWLQVATRVDAICALSRRFHRGDRLFKAQKC